MTGRFFYILLTIPLLLPHNRAAAQPQPVNGIRIAWDYTTRKLLSPSQAHYAGYARMIVLHDNTLFCVYESEGSTHAIRSKDGGRTWTTPTVVAARDNDIARAVPEALALDDHSILISYNLRPPGNNTDPARRFGVRVKRSTDGGETWSPPVPIYEAGHAFINGCWEPAQVQLPSGEVQLFIANEGPYTKSDEQEITMFRSNDRGASWSKGETVSFRRGFRDGMPVPLILMHNKEIVFAIEDNGIEPPQFKPVIVRSTLDNSWQNAPVFAASADRHHAMDENNRIPGAKYAGAPYIRQLPTGETILSYQGNEWRAGNKWDVSDMIVAIGSAQATDFNRKSKPFHFADTTKTCLWNSLTVANDSTVIALASTNGYGDRMGVWMIEGRVRQEPVAPHGILDLDDSPYQGAWQTPAFVIGGYGPTRAQVYAAWNEATLCLGADVHDDEVIAGDGITFYVDAHGHAYSQPGNGVFAVHVPYNGQPIVKSGTRDGWASASATQWSARVRRTGMGYRLVVQVPWRALGGLAAASERFGFHAALHANGAAGQYIEPVAGNNSDAPYTWSHLHLKN